MSWQTYVDSNLVGTGKISRAAILGQQGGVWAASSGYNLAADEQAFLTKVHANPESAQANGIRAAGEKYMCIRADDRSVYGKKGSSGIIVVKTKQGILVAEYVDPTQPGEATKIVEELADYLIGVGF
ncbi:hypothetical protein BMF94_0919 [Rhodotorula taiwanensis]|uniref:Profilin n=1 Tax=Rhodotorula taiwanensis TaxID=741276 RepID=A0A2S5BGD9_9BASI|nr:hypothetical protein BMF94_0919 [Rhodotorula taiwanensis]